MSILIKGMKMPNNCQSCPFSDDECRYCKAANKYIPMLGKPKFCPLVEVPASHGRLIDADKLLKKGITLSWSVQKWMSEVDIGLMPTIIKAEEGEEA